MKRPDQSILLLLVLHVLAIRCLAKDLTLSVNLKKPIAVTDEKFLSLTIDPVVLLSGGALSTDFERSINLAKALTPAYIRFGGPGSSLRCFSSQNSQDTEGSKQSALSETDFVRSHQWAEKAGLDVIACISPDDPKESGESEAARGIISFADHVRLNTNWQLGYECQGRCNLTADDFARQTLNLREILNEYPRYSNSIITGPDIVAYTNEEQQDYLREYLEIAGPALSAITWHPDLASITLASDGVFIRPDNLETDKEELYKVIGRFIENQPLWIAESGHEVYKDSYIGALVLTRRLGNAAKLNINVIMRQPTDLAQPTPDYWVSLLYKTLVGQEVFDAQVRSIDENHIHLFCQCTNPSSRYNKGSITIFGVNLSPEDAEINLKGTKIATVHQYVLLPDADTPNRMFAETVLLNNRSLGLINNTIPDIVPDILNDPNGLNLVLPSAAIGFWVFPNLKIKSCMESGVASTKNIFAGIRDLRDLSETKDTNPRDTRSAEDRTGRRSAKARQRSIDKIARRLNLKSETNRFRSFLKRILDDYESRLLLEVRGLSDSGEEKNAETMHRFRNDITTELEEFREYYSQVRQLLDEGAPSFVRDSIANYVENVDNLISRVQSTLSNANKEIEHKRRRNAANYLRALYNLLSDESQLDKSVDTELGKMERKSNRFKRGFFEEAADPANSEEDREPDWNSDAKESRADEKIKQKARIRKRVQPKFIGQGGSDNEEDNFHGFLRIESLERLPEEDVFLPAGNPRLNGDYDYADHDEYRRTKSPALDYDDADYAQSEERNDYPFYTSNKFIHEPWTLNDRAGKRSSGSEIWKVIYGSGTNDRFGGRNRQNDKSQRESSSDYYVAGGFPNNHKNSPAVPISKLERILYANQPTSGPRRQGMKLGVRKTIMPERGLDSDIKGLDFSIAGDSTEAGRFKRGDKNIHDFLDQEMIDEDDANLKDCNCRVLRHSKDGARRAKRNIVGSVMSEDYMKSIPREGTPDGFNAHVNRANLHEGVQIFSHVGDPYMQGQTVQVQASMPSFEQKPLETFQAASYLQEFPKTPVETKIIQTFDDANIPVLDTPLEYSTDPRNVQPEVTPSALPSSTTDRNNNEDSSTKKSTGRKRSKFFRDRSKTREEEEQAQATIKAESYNTTTDQENSQAIYNQKVAKRTGKTVTTKRMRSKNSDTTSRTSTISDGTIAEESKNNSKSYGVNTKRDLANQQVISEVPVNVATANPQVSTNDNKNGRGKKSVAQKKSKAAKSKESKGSKNIKTLKALRSMLREYREKLSTTPNPKLRSIRKFDRSTTKRSKQAPKVKGKLRKRGKINPRQYEKGIHDSVENVKTNEKRYIKKREVSLEMKDTDDDKDMVDLEKSAHVLLPTDYDSKIEGSNSDESIENIEAPVTKIVRPRNIRKSTLGVKNQRKSCSSKSRKAKKKMLKLSNLYNSKIGKNLDKDDEGKNRTYYALVEDLERPRIFYYQEVPENEGRISEEISSPDASYYGTEYTQNKYRPKHTYPCSKSVQYSVDRDLEDSDEFTESRKIYVIDPSEYRGGDPRLQLYKASSRSGGNSKMTPKNAYEIIWEPLVYNAFKCRQKEQHKRDERIASEDYGDHPRSADDLLEILINDLGSQTTKDLLERHDMDDNISGRIHKHSIGEEIEEEPSEERATETDEGETVEQISESREISEEKGNSESNESLELILVQNVREQRESPHPDASIEEETQTEKNSTTFDAQIDPLSASNDDSREEILYQDKGEEEKEAVEVEEEQEQENGEEQEQGQEQGDEEEEEHLRERRDTSAWSEDEYAKWSSPLLIRKAPRAVQKTAQSNHLYLKKDPEGMPNADLSKLIQILRGSNFYQAVPVKKIYTVPQSGATINRRTFPMHLRIVLPSNSDEKYPPIETPDIADTEYPAGELSEDNEKYEEEELEIENGEENSDDASSDHREVNLSKVSEMFNAGGEDIQRGEGSNEGTNLKEDSDKPEFLMPLSLDKTHGRYRREAGKPETNKEDSNAAKVQPLELQLLDESLTPSIPTLAPIDDIEKSLAQKIPLEKYTAKENINKKKNIRKNKKANQDSLSSLVAASVPKLENVVVDSLQKAQNITGSVEQLIENLDDKYNSTLYSEQQNNSTDPETSGVSQYIFDNAIMNVKKFFILLTGINHLIRP